MPIPVWCHFQGPIPLLTRLELPLFFIKQGSIQLYFLQVQLNYVQPLQLISMFPSIREALQLHLLLEAILIKLESGQPTLLTLWVSFLPHAMLRLYPRHAILTFFPQQAVLTFCPQLDFIMFFL